MKLTAAQLEQHLNQTLSKVYLVCGEDPFLVQEAMSLVRKKALAAGFSDRVRLDIETDADLENSYNYAYTPPLLSQRRIVELHWKGKLSKNGQQFLQAYAQRPSPHNLLLVRLGKLDSKTEQTQWFKALEKNAVVIAIWPLPPQQLPAWLKQRAKTYKLDLTPEAAQLLAHYVEGNLQAAAQELEKLSLLDTATIDHKTIESLVIDQGCFSAFDLVDQAFAGNSSQVLRILHYLQNEGSDPLMVLGAFTFELRTAAKIARELKKGGALPVLFSQYRIRLNKQSGLRDFLKRNSEQHLFKLFLKAGEVDRLAKGAIQGSVWLALEQLSLKVAGSISFNPL